MITDKAKTHLKRLIEAFESGRIGEVVKRTVIPPLDVPCTYWSMCNRVLVALSDTEDARGYKQWKDTGRFVKKGSKAIYIFVPWCYKKETEEEEEEEYSVLRGFITAPVFRFEDTDGEPIERPVREPPELPKLYDIATSFGLDVKYQGHHGMYYGSYSDRHKQITLETHDEKTFWHELGHAAHARVVGKLKAGQDPKQEAVAELAATVIASLYGSDWSGNCWEYIQAYSQNPLSLCLSVIADVEKVLAEILHYVPESELEAA